MATYINIPYGYTIQTYDDGSRILTVTDNDGERLEFDCEGGNIIIAGCYDEIEPFEMTLPKCLETAREFFADWNIQDDVAEAIISDLHDWFAGYCISEEEADKREIAELKERIKRRKADISTLKRIIRGRRKEIQKLQDDINETSSGITRMEIAICEMEKRIRELEKGGK